MHDEILTSTEAARLLGVEAWRIRRIFELGLVREAARLAGRRVVLRSQLPAIVVALQSRGWFPVAQPAAVVAPILPGSAESTACSAEAAPCN